MSKEAAAAPAPQGLLEELVADLPEPDGGNEAETTESEGVGGAGSPGVRAADGALGTEDAGGQADDAEAPEAEPAEEQDAEAIKPLTDEELGDLPEPTRKAIAARLEQARDSKRTHDKAYLKLKSRESKFNERVQGFNREKHATFALRDQLQASLNILRNGDGKAVLSAIQQLTGRDPHGIVEGINMSIVGKKRPDAETQELRQTVTELRQELQSMREEAKRAREQETHSRAEQEAIQRLVSSAKNASAYPRLAAYTADNLQEVQAALVNIKIQAYNSNGNIPISDHEACNHLESHLERLASYNSGQATAAPPNPEAGRAPSANPGKQPARRSPAQSLTAAQLASGHSQRVMSEREHYETLAEDPDINRALGGWLNQ